MSAVITPEELAKHNTPGDMWMAVNGDVYNVSKFAKLHPGGAQVLEQYAGKDVTVDFHELHRRDVLDKYTRLRVGRLSGSASAVEDPSEFSKVPFAEVPAMQGRSSPYYSDSHRRLTLATRRFVRAELEPIAETADLAGDKPDREMQGKLGRAGLMVGRMGPGPWMKDLADVGIELPGGVPPAEFDYFHEMLIHQEFARLGRPGFIDSCGAGWLISAPAVYHFASKDVLKVLGPQLLRGEKWSALAISEPFAGSDVAAVRTTAKKTPDGKFYIVNGIKKWITEGTYADYFVTAVRTGEGAGAKALSMLLVERGEGVDTKQIKTTYSTCCGTAMVIMNNVKVPVENLMGKEGEGFKQIMFNFNHERWMITASLLGQARAALADTFMWARQRKIFGKSLIDQPVIRHKLASAAAALECVFTFMESVTHDMCKHGPHNDVMAGPIALLKYESTRTALKVSDDCVQIMGGRGITRTGMGSKVEGFKNFVKYAAVYGGSEEIMAELAIKQALKTYPATAKL